MQVIDNGFIAPMAREVKTNEKALIEKASQLKESKLFL